MTRKTEKKREGPPLPDQDADEVEIVSVDAVDSEGRPLEADEAGELGQAEGDFEPADVLLDEESEAPARSGAEAEELRERWLRARADLENYRKRVERDRDRMRVQARESILSDLLPVLDDLDRALAAGGEGEGLREGVELIARSLEERLARFGLERIPAEGETFDPHLHEAGETEPTERVPAHTVVAELRSGYRIGDHLLRPVLVRVAVSPEREEGS